MATNTGKTTNTGAGLTRETLAKVQSAGTAIATELKSGAGLYSSFNSPIGTAMKNRTFLKSRLWHGVPELTEEQMRMFEAAYTGHQFFFVTGLPKFMTTGAFTKDTNVYNHAYNLKAIIEKCCMGFSGPSNIQVNFGEQDDGAGRKLSHVTSVQKDQNDISLKLHEFAGLPVKNALETWVRGMYDPISQHGNYFGNLNIDGGWCLANHTMSMLVVQVDPSWTEIQDAAFYCNMVPTEVPFDEFQFTKGESQIIEDYDLSFKVNEIRSSQILVAAEKYMNYKILTMVDKAVYNSSKFEPISSSAIPTTPDYSFVGPTPIESI